MCFLLEQIQTKYSNSDPFETLVMHEQFVAKNCTVTKLLHKYHYCVPIQGRAQKLESNFYIEQSYVIVNEKETWEVFA